jgi:hypothetical protein
MKHACLAAALLLAATSSASSADPIQDALLQMKACVTSVYNSPEAAPIRPHAPLNPAEPTIAQLSDQSSVTRAQAVAISLIHPRVQAWQRQILTDAALLAPVALPILQRAYAAADDDTALLLQRRISWGERVRRSRDRALSVQAELLGLVQQASQQRAATAIAPAQAAEARPQRGNPPQGYTAPFLSGQVPNGYTAPFLSGQVPSGYTAPFLSGQVPR